MKRRQSSIKRKRGPGGNVVWTAFGHSYYWNGPGSRLSLMIGDQLVRIDHPSVNRFYDSEREAGAAVRRFCSSMALDYRRTGEPR